MRPVLRPPPPPARETLPPLLRRYVELRGGPGQIAAFAAAAAGAKPVLDDWIPVATLDDFVALAASAGLHCVIDCFFEFLPENGPVGAEVVGGSQLNTTRAIAHPPSRRKPGTAAHVLLSKDRARADEACATGWYGLPVDGRVVEKPWIDHDRFGELLGYPLCCRRFFAANNDWNTKNTLSEAMRVTGSPTPWCNSLMKHSGFSYLCHLPCAFDCQATRAIAEAAASVLRATCGPIAAYVEALASRPYLVLSEWEAFGFVGTVLDARRVRYETVFEVPSNRPDHELSSLLARGDEVEIEGPVLRVRAGGRVIGAYEARCDRFGPQAPFVVDFSGGAASARGNA